ncbi:MAG: AAA family ATPase [Ruminococcus sp.]|nr:AAA family ATPase [Ruminococcus sp.]
MDFKPIPIGIEDFKELVNKGYYFVDKTLMIKDIIDTTSKVNLFTRPRRFGKTLNMSMIQRYFEKTEEDNAYLFEGLNISKAGEKYKEYQGQYPVITLSLKSMKQSCFEDAFLLFKNIISKEFYRHKEILSSDNISEVNKREYISIVEKTADSSQYLYALKLLSDCLKEAYNKNVIILIDEYDVPLESAYFGGFYDDMVNLIRSVFESALKTNPSLEFGILTGCLRISRESIFTGLNNLKVNSITTHIFSEYFGFTKEEVKKFAEAYGLEKYTDEIKNWYDGYIFGNTEIYNPWSIINFISDARNNENVLPKPYWSNTSSNDIIHDLVVKGDNNIHNSIEKLLNNSTVTAPLYEDITYRNIDVNSDYIWSFLLFTGYLKATRYFMEDDILYAEMVLPNKEIRSIYRNTITKWFKESIRKKGTDDLFNAVIQGNTDAIETEINRWLRKCISYHDNYENFYHGFLAGLLIGSDEYIVKSNRESGNGRSDIMICEYQLRKIAVIIEIKVAEKFAELDKKCYEALQQIEDRNYEAELIDECYQNIIKYGVAFYQKSCKIKKA